MVDESVFLYHDYEISEQALTSTAEKPKPLKIIVFSIIVILLNVSLGFYLFSNLARIDRLGAKLIFGVVFGLSVFILGLIGGKLWQSIGLIGARAIYLPFIKSKQKLNWYSSLYVRFLESGSQVYLEGNSKDPRLKGFRSILRLTFRVSLSQVGFYITATTFLLRPMVGTLRSVSPFYQDYQDFINVIFALAVSVILLGLYLPMSFILEDSNMKTFDVDSRMTGIPGMSVRSKFDTLVGIGALTSGWGIFLELRSDLGDSFVVSGDSTLFQSLDYLAWLIFILLISWPLILPASLYYFLQLEKIINTFRTNAIVAGVPIGVSMIREPKEEEKDNIEKFISSQQ